MNIEELNKLEEKVKVMVNRLKHINAENKRLKAELQELKKESSLNSEEKELIEKKVTTLIELIDSIDQ